MAMMETVGWQWYAAGALLLPVLGAMLAATQKGRVADTFGTLGASGALLAMLGLLATFSHAGVAAPLRATWSLMPWLPGEAGEFGLLIDGLCMILLIVAVVIGLLVVLFSAEYLSPRNREHVTEDGKGRYYFWLLMFLAAMVGLAMSPNLLQMFVFWELTTICSWALISFYNTREANAAGYKALVMTGAGGVLFVGALLLAYAFAGDFGFDALARAPREVAVAGFLMLLVAAWAKAAQVPFFTWLPDAIAAPTPISAYLHAAAMVKAGVFLMARVIHGSYIAVSALPGLGVGVAVAALVTMLIGLYFYFLQDDLNRLLAFSTITHLGYVLFGLGLGAAGVWLGFQAAMLHIMMHGFAKTLLFLVVGGVAYATGSRSISRLSGLGARMPWSSFAFGVGLMAVCGIPPLSCFWSKVLLAGAVVKLGGGVAMLLDVSLVIEATLALFWFLRVGQRVFFGEPSAAADEAVEVPRPMAAVIGALVVLCLLAPLIALPFLPPQPI